MYREHCGTCQVELFSLCFHISTVLPSRSFLFVSNRYGFWCFFMLFTYNSPCEKQGFIKLLIFERRKPAPSRTICACSYEFFFSTSGSCQGHCRETGGLNITSRMSLIHEEKGMAEDEMVRWHHWLQGHEFEHTLVDRGGKGSLVYCSPRGCKESDTT